MRAQPTRNVGGLADARSRNRIAETAELRDFEAHKIDRAVGSQPEDLTDRACALVSFDGYGGMIGHKFQPGMVVRVAGLLENLHAEISNLGGKPDRSLGLVGLVGIDREPDCGPDLVADRTNTGGIEIEMSIDLDLDVAIA